MDVYERNATQIYSLNSHTLLPEWIDDRVRRKICRNNPSVRRRIELLQDLAFPDSSSRLSTSPDGCYLLASGSYPPRICCYDFYELGKKFERYVDSEVVDIAFVGNDYRKFTVLANDRTVSFHAPYGLLCNVRLPTFGCALAYERSSCMLFVASLPGIPQFHEKTHPNRLKGGCVYRIDLEEGRFTEPLMFTAEGSVSGRCLAISPSHRLMAFGGEDGKVRFWDTRIGGMKAKNILPFCELNIATSIFEDGNNDQDFSVGSSRIHDISSIEFDLTGMYLAAGTSFGKVALYDMRSSKPLHVQAHQYGMPVHTLKFHNTSGTVLSSDTKIVKVWRYTPSPTFTHREYSYSHVDTSSYSSSVGTVIANVEGKSNFTHFQLAGDEKDPMGQSSGLLLCAGEQPRVQTFYVPSLGAAPKWCSFLDNITEELEEKEHFGKFHSYGNDTTGNGLIYDDYKFLTLSEIESMGIQALIGTPLLRGYMHGFFIDVNLYHRVRSVSRPFEYEEYRLNKIRQKLEDKVSSQILPKHLHKSKKIVNADLVARLRNKAERRENSRDSQIAQNIITDDRFGRLFCNPDFEIDENDENFKLRNPSGKRGIENSFKDKEYFVDSDNEYKEQDTTFLGNYTDINKYHQESTKTRTKKYIDKELMNSYYYDVDDKWNNDCFKHRNQESNTTAIVQGVNKTVMKNVTCESFGDFEQQEKAFNIGLGDIKFDISGNDVRREEVSLSIGERINQTGKHGSLSGKQSRNFDKSNNNEKIKVKGCASRREAMYVPMHLNKNRTKTGNV